jgi:hypothetical protein
MKTKLLNNNINQHLSKRSGLRVLGIAILFLFAVVCSVVYTRPAVQSDDFYKCQ